MVTSYSNKLVELLGGKEFLQKTIQANNFIGGRIFTKEKTLLSFSFKGNKYMNFVCISKPDKYTISFYKVTLFKHRLIAEFTGVKEGQLISLFEAQTGLKITKNNKCYIENGK